MLSDIDSHVFMASFSGKTVALLESLLFSASLVDVVGTVLFLMSLGASMDLPGQHPSPLHQLRQLHSLQPNGTARLSKTFATGTTPRKMTLTGLGSLAVHHQLGPVHRLTTQLEVRKVNTLIRLSKVIR